ncbi:MAG: DsbA family oxidoreductase [Actinomycetota bacterium]|nr:DsbA family oxidoreductase [Actinomycetota bacterium]
MSEEPRTAPMSVEIWSDVVCPWCYIGKRRFEAALAAFPHRDDVAVTWRSFELDPHAPRVRSESPAEALAAKYGMSVEEARAAHASITEVAAREGLEYRLDRARRGNTFDAHRIIHLAAAHGRQGEAQERLMRAYFTDGEEIGQPATLVRLAAEVGLDPREAGDVLAGNGCADAVRDDVRLAVRMGIRAVPYFVLDRRYGVSGAQPPEQLLAALHRGWDARAGSAAA